MKFDCLRKLRYLHIYNSSGNQLLINIRKWKVTGMLYVRKQGRMKLSKIGICREIEEYTRLVQNVEFVQRDFFSIFKIRSAIRNKNGEADGRFRNIRDFVKYTCTIAKIKQALSQSSFLYILLFVS